MSSADLYEFHARVVKSDPTGYYFPRWDNATPVTVVAETRDEAFQKVFSAMGKCEHGWRWEAVIDKITPHIPENEATK